jgi:N-acetylglucosaminyldiphosphoundecaprenol N-acetyl-beta-D-mannosaminyltransferase
MRNSNMPQSDGGSPARINILGVGVSAIHMAEAVRRCERLLAARQKGYVCVTGVHGIMEAQRDPDFREILNRSFLCTPDGMPTVWIGRARGHGGTGRVYGPDFMLELCRNSVASEHRHFLYGGGPGTVDKLRSRLEELVPGIQIAGTYTPPFRPLSPEEEGELIATIANTNSHIVWVGLSTPKQERFMARMLPRLGNCLMVGVGAAFDIHAGLKSDAPAWMKSCGLQWLHRLQQEPRRLWRRYLSNNPRFVWQVALQLAGIRKFDLPELV